MKCYIPGAKTSVTLVIIFFASPLNYLAGCGK